MSDQVQAVVVARRAALRTAVPGEVDDDDVLGAGRAGHVLTDRVHDVGSGRVLIDQRRHPALVRDDASGKERSDRLGVAGGVGEISDLGIRVSIDADDNDVKHGWDPRLTNPRRAATRTREVREPTPVGTRLGLRAEQ